MLAFADVQAKDGEVGTFALEPIVAFGAWRGDDLELHNIGVAAYKIDDKSKSDAWEVGLRVIVPVRSNVSVRGLFTGGRVHDTTPLEVFSQTNQRFELKSTSSSYSGALSVRIWLGKSSTQQ